jgi:general secretion pathway protein K
MSPAGLQEPSEMISPHRSAGRTRNDGFIVVAVLWILAVLATLAVIYSLYVRESAAAFLNHNERLQAQALAMSGIELAVYRLTEVPRQRPSLGRFRFREGSAAIGVAFAAENGRIDLNFAAKELFAGLFVGLGADPQSALNFADRIVAWRTPLAAGAQDTEAPIYQSAGKPYGPRHGPFQSVDEVELVTGLPGAFVDRALPYLTVYSGQAAINVLSAPPTVIAALPGMTPDRLQLLIGARDSGASADAIRGQIGSAASYVATLPSAANRIKVDIRFESGRRIRSQAIVLLVNKDTEPYRMLSARDEELATDVRDDDAGWQ